MMELFAKGIKDNIHLVKDQLDKSLSLDLVPTLESLKAGLSGSLRIANNSVGTSGFTNPPSRITQNFYQYNNSPKALNRLEIYRQTKNQLNFAKGV